MDDSLTTAQRQALDKAWEILTEHFDHVVIAFETEVHDGTDRSFGANWKGGLTTAIGIAERTRKRLSDKAERIDNEEL